MYKRLIVIVSTSFLFIFTLLLLAVAPTVAQVDVAATVNTGELRVVNALIGVGPVDVYLNDERIAYNLQPEAATAYFNISSGKHSLAVRPVAIDPLSAPIADILIDLAPNHSRTAIVYQKQFRSADFEPSVQESGTFFIVDDDRSPIQLGYTRLTAVHLALGNPGRISVGYPSKESLLHQISLEQHYGTIDIPADKAYSLNVIDADNPELDILERYGDYNFYANTLYTIVVVPDLSPILNPNGTLSYRVGDLSNEPHMFVISSPIDPPDQNGLRLRIVHAAHSTLVLDIYIDERMVASRVNYSRITEYLGLENYSHTVSIRRFGASPTSAPLAQANFTINSENQSQRNWTLLLLNANDTNTAALEVIQPGVPNPSTIINTPNGRMLMALIPDNVSQTQRGYARVRLIDAADGVPALRLFTPSYPLPPVPFGVIPTATPTPEAPLPPVQLINTVLFGDEAGAAEVPAGLYKQLNIVPGGSDQTLVSISDVQLVSGMVYTFVVMGSPLGNPQIEAVTLEEYGVGVPVNRLFLGSITTATANIRVNPSASSRVSALLPRGTEVEVLGRTFNGQWVRIRYTDPVDNLIEEGWISGVANIMEVTRLGVPVSVLTLPVYTSPTEGGE